jgi:geranylgeranyl pyrophosphate synthase
MWQKRQVELLKEELEAILSTLSFEPRFYRFIKELVLNTKYGLDSLDGLKKPWPLLPLMVCEAISGHCEQALFAAATLHLMKISAEIFDDIEDEDFPDSLHTKQGPALAINAATTFIALAENTILRLKDRNTPSELILRVCATVNSYFTFACTGQHLDLSFSDLSSMSEDGYLKLISMKSAVVTACASKIGALLATDDEKLIDLFTAFGHNLGMSSQIANDISGITKGNDIQKQKITLPIIFSFAQADTKTREKIESTFSKLPGSLPDAAQIKELLFSSGAIQYAALKMDAYKQEASDILTKVNKVKVDTKRLVFWVE